MKLPPGHVAGVGVVKPTGYGGYGERMLKTMGWDKGQGLGRTGEGIKEAIQVKKKEDSVGVGGRASWKWDDNWWERAYSESSAAIDAVKKDEDSSSSSSSSESEDDATTCVSRRNRDGTASSASAHELALLDALTQGGSRLAAGRFGGREGKMSRIRAQEAREAAAAAAALGTAVPDGRTSKSKKARSDADARPASQEPAAPRIVVEVHSAEASAAAAAAAALWRPTELEGWWGRGMFSPAGVLEGMRKAQEDAKRGFTEDDQEGVYMAAHASKTQGRVGLGQAQRAVKVGGVAWTGTKVQFDEAGEDGAQTSGAGCHADAACQTQAAGPSTEARPWEALVRWKAVTQEFLRGAKPSGASLKRVGRHVVSHVAVRLQAKGHAHDAMPGEEEIAAVLLRKLQGSRQFVLEGKRVRLAA
ncbi:hypothetical protein ACKKBG_A33620 [Auxenochlorella protothecoides x Auxenochlorella symbiontica]